VLNSYLNEVLNPSAALLCLCAALICACELPLEEGTNIEGELLFMLFAVSSKSKLEIFRFTHAC